MTVFQLRHLQAFKFIPYLEKQLVLCDSLHWLDQVRGDGVSKAVSLLDFLRAKTGKKIIHTLGKELLSLLVIIPYYRISHLRQSMLRHVQG